MDALDLLKSDHERVSSIYDRLKTENDSRERRALIERLRNELLIHTHAEETVFYPAFKNYPDFQQILSQSYEDHRNIRNHLKKITNDDRNAIDSIDSMMKEFQEHVEMEESELFPMVRKLMRRSERETLGRHIQAAKNEPAAAAA